MDPASIFSCIDAALGICGKVLALCQAIKDIQELPEAFQHLETKMALVEAILKKTRDVIGSRTEAGDRDVATNAVKLCQAQIEQLQGILEVVKQNSGASREGNPKLWSSMKTFYRNAVLRLGKGSKGRVEDLTKDILESLRLLSTWCGLEEQLKKAVDDMDHMQATLEDHECEPSMGNNMLTIGGNVHGITAAQSYGRNQVDQHAPGSFHFADSQAPINLAGTIENHIHHHLAPPVPENPDRIKNWLMDLAKHLAFEDVQRKMLQSATGTPGAGRWFTKSPEFKSWKEGQSRKIFCYGKPGAGKTVLMSLAIEKLMSKKSGEFCIYAFLDSGLGDAKNLTNLLSTLLIQLLDRGKGVCDAIQEKHDEFKRSRQKPTTKGYISMLKAQMEFLLPHARRIFLVVDALDQLDDETLPVFLKDCSELPQNVHMLFTSTYDNSDIIDLIKPDKKMEIAAHNQDITAYFEEAFNTNQYLQRAIKEADPAFRDQVLHTVVQKSQNYFLLSKLHLQRLTFHAKLYHSLETCLIGLSETPDEFYRKALESSKQKEPRLGIIMSWLLFAERAITIDELGHAMEIQRQIEKIKSGRSALPGGNAWPNLEFTLKNVCASFVEVDLEEKIQFQHLSAKQYLLNNESELIEGARTMIADICLVCLHHIPPERSSKTLPTVETLKKRCRQYPLLRYAADHWGDHMRFKKKGKHEINFSAWELLTNAQILKNATQIMSDFEFSQEEAVSGMHVAAYFGLVELIRNAQKNNKSIDINACTTHRQESVLHWAVKHRQHAFQELLIKHGACLTSKDDKGRTALYVAVAMDDVCSVEMLLSTQWLQRQQYINIAEKMQVWAPLHFAVSEGKSQIVEMLLDARAEVNNPDKDGFTPLCLAYQQAYLKIVELLVDNKASLEVTSSDGKRWSLLERSAADGRTQVIQLLMKKGVDLSAPVTDDGKTPLRLAVDYRRGTIMWLLLEARVDVDMPDNEGKTPLYWAAENNQLSAMCFLLEHDAKTTAAPSQPEMMTPLHIAALKGYASAVFILLNVGADPFKADINNHTALYWAIVEGHIEIVQLLLLKADARRLLYDRDDEDRTALHHAASQGRLEVSKILISYGADKDAKDVEGNTALDLSHNGAHDDVSQYLSSLGSDTETNHWHTVDTSEMESQDGDVPEPTGHASLESSFEARELSETESETETESDSQWSEGRDSDADGEETTGRFRASVEDDSEEE